MKTKIYFAFLYNYIKVLLYIRECMTISIYLELNIGFQDKTGWIRETGKLKSRS